MFETINNMIVTLSHDPFSPELSFKLAQEYEKEGQTASAVSFYLRTAEYGYESHPEYVYAALLKSSECFKNQQNREHTVMDLILKAIAYLPNRPEAWFILARHYEQTKKWQESYTACEVGLLFSRTRLSTLPLELDYLGEYVLRFEKAVSGWWVGRQDEAIQIFRDLLKEDIAPIYRVAINNNLEKIG
jgi:tetratricopeptide (TPR) repeat protein